MIVNIMGESGAGKTVLVNYLISQYPNTYQRVISYTNRCKRKNEIRGIDYNFVDTTFFQKNNDLVFKREREDGLYAIKKNDFFASSNKIVLTTFPPKGILLLEELGFSVKAFYLLVEPEESKRRMLERGDDPVSVANRLIADKMDATLEVATAILKGRFICVLDGHQPTGHIGLLLHAGLFPQDGEIQSFTI